MILLCIDASTSNFGLAWFKNGDLFAVYHLEVKGTFDLHKLGIIYKEISRFLSNKPYLVPSPINYLDPFGFDLKVSPRVDRLDFVVFEQPAPVRFSKALTSINQVMGVLIGVCMERRIEFDWVHNRTVKKLAGITGKGIDGKKQSVELAQGLYPEFKDQIISDHVADAIHVGEAYKHIVGTKDYYHRRRS